MRRTVAAPSSQLSSFTRHRQACSHPTIRFLGQSHFRRDLSHLYEANSLLFPFRSLSLCLPSPPFSYLLLPLSATKWELRPFGRSGERCKLPWWGLGYILKQGVVFGGNYFRSFCGKQNVYLKFLNQSGSQFRVRLHYVIGRILIQRGSQAWGQNVSLGQLGSPSQW